MGGRLDRVPWQLRLVPAAASALLILHSVGLVELHAPGAPGPALLGGLGAAAGSALGLLAARRARRRGAVRGRPPSGCKAFIVRATGGREAAEALLRALQERARSAGVSYLLASYMDDGGVATVMAISGREESVIVESEIVKAIASAMGGVRLEEVEASRVCEAAREAASLPRRGLLAPSMIPEAPLRRSRGPGVVVGYTLDTPQPRPVTVTRDDIEGHVGIFGATGSGKSTTAAVLACAALELGFIPVIADWTGEYQAKLPCRGRFKIIDPVRAGVAVDPVTLAVTAGDPDLAVEVLSQALALSDPQEHLLYTVLQAGRPSSLRQLYEKVEDYPEASKWDREVKRGLARKLGALLRGSHSTLFSGEVRPPPIEGPLVVRLDNIRLTTARRTYALLLLAWLYTASREGRLPASILYLVDEAHNIMGGEQPLVETVVSESRKYGLHMAIVTQAPSLIPDRVLLNTNTKIAHAIKSPRDKAVIAEAMGLPQRLASQLERLAPGEAVMTAPSLAEPILLQVEYRGEP